MRLETRRYLEDALAAAEEVLQIAIAGWQEDRVLALAIERLLMNVGEALSRVRFSDPDLLNGVPDAFKVIGMRNVLAHGYDSLDPDRIRDAVEKNLPKLARDIREVVGQTD
ncbi:MAG: hypothetical protein AMXMBFR81_23370 [Chthonomonas sp.]